MRASVRLKLIDAIGRELQNRYSFQEIDQFLAVYRLRGSNMGSYNSKWVYSKSALAEADEATLLQIAAELELVSEGESDIIPPPRNWADNQLFRLFISHISAEKLKATRLRDALRPHNVLGFVAHEDIHPTMEWQTEIERGLHTMDAFLAIHTVGFSSSFWTQQEVGFAVGKGVKIISLKMGEDPTGFISKRQALARRSRKAEEIATEVVGLLAEDRRTSEKLALAQKAQGRSLDDEIPF